VPGRESLPDVTSAEPRSAAPGRPRRHLPADGAVRTGSSGRGAPLPGASGRARPGARPDEPAAARRPPPANQRVPLGDRRRPARGTEPAGRVRRFVARYGWRAYALPLLTVATLLTLVDLAASGVPEAAARTDSSISASTPGGTPAPRAAQGEGRPAGDVPVVPGAAPYVEQGAGRASVVDGTSRVYGSGPLKRFVVEVEDGIDVDDAGFAAAVEATLGDPRSWGNGGAMSFQRVGATDAAAGSYDFRVTLVSPGSMEVFCPGVGTDGYTSCRYGERAVINLARWETAVPDYDGDIATYRQYVVNHEVGHALGHGHAQCPGPGQPAPVMEQQTMGLQGCTRNAWPHP
jgi:uncharacterized protein DUF3152